MTDLQNRVQRGAQWMDENYPGWVDEIDLDSLNMGDEFSCVAAQASGMRYGDVCEDHFGECSIEISETRAYQIGLYDSCQYRELTEAWRMLILERRSTVETEKTSIDELMRAHAERMHEMHDNNTVGDYSFLGALSIFMVDLKKNGHLG